MLLSPQACHTTRPGGVSRRQIDEPSSDSSLVVSTCSFTEPSLGSRVPALRRSLTPSSLTQSLHFSRDPGFAREHKDQGYQGPRTTNESCHLVRGRPSCCRLWELGGQKVPLLTKVYSTGISLPVELYVSSRCISGRTINSDPPRETLGKDSLLSKCTNLRYAQNLVLLVKYTLACVAPAPASTGLGSRLSVPLPCIKPWPIPKALLPGPLEPTVLLSLLTTLPTTSHHIHRGPARDTRP